MATYYPPREQLECYRGQGTIVPVYREVLADLETPVSTYLKLARGPYSFLLESVEGGERLGRYSFIGTEPYLVLRLNAGQAEAFEPATGRVEHFTFDDPLHAVMRYLEPLRVVPLPDLPRFHGGAVGYLAYECVRYFERIPAAPLDDLQVPEAVLMYCDTLVVFDHVRHTMLVLTHARLDGDLDQAYEAAVERIERVVQRLREPLPPNGRYGGQPSVVAPRPATLSANQTPEQFMAAVRKIKEYIAAGDCIQVVPSQRLARPVRAHPFTVYRALRTINPSPYMFYLDLGGFQLVGASPELLVQVENRIVRTRPLAGTRRRGRTEEEDAALRAELLADEKERAEHIMLVDLGRNDLGRVCKPGTVKVTRLMDVEKYSHVMHIVSEVEGVLRDELTAADALRATFPAGTLSGAPKIRAMEIIAEVEPTRRGPYGGAVGYFSYSGNLDTAITIRTMLVKDGIAYVQAGAGIVADSEPEREHQECLNKAAALLRALDKAEELLTESAPERAGEAVASASGRG
jgi:anthranilate synthase component 1